MNKELLEFLGTDKIQKLLKKEFGDDFELPGPSENDDDNKIPEVDYEKIVETVLKTLENKKPSENKPKEIKKSDDKKSDLVQTMEKLLSKTENEKEKAGVAL